MGKASRPAKFSASVRSASHFMQPPAQAVADGAEVKVERLALFVADFGAENFIERQHGLRKKRIASRCLVPPAEMESLRDGRL